jgi:site-specific DNA-methyltransferase (adenine-specific)
MNKMIPYYDVDCITIFCDDCLRVMPQLEPPFDMILADLPYGTTACEWDSIIPLEPLWVEYKRLIKGNGAVSLFADEPFSSVLGVSNLDWLKYKWIWIKNRPSDKFNAKNKPMDAQEDILIFSPGTMANCSNNMMVYNPQGLTPTRTVVMGKTGQRHHGTRPSHKEKYIMEFTDYPINVLYYSKDEPAIHPTQKPVALMSYLIRTYTNPGELILDNTMGSGTTLVAAQNEGRRAVGIEISEDYCKIAVDRLRQKSLFSIIKPENRQEVEQLSL